MGLLNNIFNSIKKASRPRLEITQESKTVQVLLDSKDESYFTLEFDEMSLNKSSNLAILEENSIYATSSKYGSMFIESIKLRKDYNWVGSAGGHFEYFIKKQLSEKNIELKKTYDRDAQRFAKYQIDFENELGIIWFSLGSNLDLFIVDSCGKVFNDLLEYFNIKDKELFIEDFKNFDFNTTSTITQDNLVENYIEKEIH